ncbi:hypothetical protein NKH18_39765 [Streptomyces sp. M10(2022)]
MIINGRNLHPQDVEHALRDRHNELDGLPAAAFSVPVGGSDGSTDDALRAAGGARPPFAGRCPGARTRHATRSPGSSGYVRRASCSCAGPASGAPRAARSSARSCESCSSPARSNHCSRSSTPVRRTRRTGAHRMTTAANGLGAAALDQLLTGPPARWRLRPRRTRPA